MLYHLFQYLESFDFPGAGVFQYITFRSACAIILSLIIATVVGEKSDPDAAETADRGRKSVIWVCRARWRRKERRRWGDHYFTGYPDSGTFVRPFG